ncbi:hypothetical protein MMC26_004025 [Xylographa opegraphella]|nr:hypothetical protein [Xylographa opegraphella]
MPPPSATTTEAYTNGDAKPSAMAPHEPGLSETKAKVQMPRFPGPRKFQDKYEERDYLKGRLAAAFRIFGKYGFDEGVAGHITMRDPVDPTTFWVNPFGVAFSMMRKSDLIQVDHSGKVIDGGEDHVLYTAFNGIVLAEKEGLDIAACLGNKKAALLQNHGLLTVGATIEAAVFWFISLEKCCHAQLMADAAAGGRGGETKKIGDEEAAYTYKTIGTPLAGWFSAKPEFDKMYKAEGDEFLQ